jgi:hypothetical protein
MPAEGGGSPADVGGAPFRRSGYEEVEKKSAKNN